MHLTLSRQFISIEDELYEIIHTINEEKKPKIEMWKELLECEKVFRKEGFLFFCRKVEEAQIVTEELF